MTKAKIGDDILSTSDIDEMIQDLEDELSDFEKGDLYQMFLHQEEDEDTLRELTGDDYDAIDQLVTILSDLNDFKNELEDYCDWRHGETLIREEYRPQYAEDLARDIGAIGESADWIKIDWEATAEELFQHDYTYAEIEGETYYVRTC